MLIKFWTTLGPSGAFAGLALAVMALAACGSAAEPTQVAPAPTAEPVTTAPAAPLADSSSSAVQDPQPQDNAAPKFSLPSAAGGDVRLDSYAGDKNVVLVFYRGFW